MLKDLVRLVLLLAALALVLWLYVKWFGKWFPDSSPVQVRAELPVFQAVQLGGK